MRKTPRVGARQERACAGGYHTNAKRRFLYMETLTFCSAEEGMHKRLGLGFAKTVRILQIIKWYAKRLLFDTEPRILLSIGRENAQSADEQ